MIFQSIDGFVEQKPVRFDIITNERLAFWMSEELDACVPPSFVLDDDVVEGVQDDEHPADVVNRNYLRELNSEGIGLGAEN